MRKHFKWDKKYLYWGMTAFCVVACAILFYMALNYISLLGSAVKGLFRILSPFVWGLALTYLLAPIMRWLENVIFLPLFRSLYKKNKKGKDGKKPARALAVLFSELFVLLILAALVYLVIPQLYNSIESMVVNSNGYLEKISGWFSRQLKDYPEIERYVSSALGGMQENIIGWLTGSVLPELGSVISNVAGGVYVFMKGLYNLFIGMIVSVYILSNLEIFNAKSKRLLYCVFTVEATDKICDGLDFTNKTFMSYVSATLVDALIICLLCYIFCAVVNIPYALLVSVLVGVTNIIPFFGPFIGAVPAALIILLDSPVKCLIFIIYTVVSQQLDGNYIKPKILGNTVGISGVWVLFSIILGAGLFGFWGMLLGVPVFVVIYTLMELLIERKLKRSDLPSTAEDYMDMDRIDPVTRNVILKNGSVRKNSAFTCQQTDKEQK